MIDTPTSRRHHRPATGWPSGESAHSRKRRANHYMRHGLERLDPDEAIPFFCECDDPDCFAPAWLTRQAYDRLRANAANRALTAPHRAAAS